ncbi:MAG: polyprenyl synthetase family protein [Chlorobi bacterium]|nr:polyprenyl synthetase family protein [Chlorobiota bacterium]
MYSVAQLQKITEENLKKIKFTSQPIELYEPIKYVLSNGGKRLRPVLTLMAYNIYNNTVQDAINAAIAVEIFHNFTLLHDDIMDHATVRRNKPTVHSKWDENRAILSGDAMLIKSYEFISKSHSGKLNKVLEVFNKIALEVCEGQQFDMNFEVKKKVSVNDYIKMITLKTAVLLAGSLKIGAIIGGANTEDTNKLYAFGVNMGIAFQLQDDLLDAFGNETKFGKKIGGDILENKKTFLLIRAFELADKNNLAILNKYIPGTNSNKKEKIEAILSVYHNLNIKKITQEKIKDYLRKADILLKEVSVDNKRLSVLKSFTNNLLERSY